MGLADFAQRLTPRESILTWYMLPSLPLDRLPTGDSAALVIGPSLCDLLMSREAVCLFCVVIYRMWGKEVDRFGNVFSHHHQPHQPNQ